VRWVTKSHSITQWIGDDMASPAAWIRRLEK